MSLGSSSPKHVLAGPKALCVCVCVWRVKDKQFMERCPYKMELSGKLFLNEKTNCICIQVDFFFL